MVKLQSLCPQNSSDQLLNLEKQVNFNGHWVFVLYLSFQEINYDSPRGGVSVITEKGELTTSYLLVQRARVSDSGRYTCAPSNANPSTVSVHILSGEFLVQSPLTPNSAAQVNGRKIFIPPLSFVLPFDAGEGDPAAMQHAGQLKIGNPVYILFLALLTVVLRRR